jgi:hypothetical protein
MRNFLSLYHRLAIYFKPKLFNRKAFLMPLCANGKITRNQHENSLKLANEPVSPIPFSDSLGARENNSSLNQRCKIGVSIRAFPVRSRFIVDCIYVALAPWR